MSGKWHGGKGSAPRKTADQSKYESNWDRIFGKKCVECGEGGNRHTVNCAYEKTTGHFHEHGLDWESGDLTSFGEVED